MSISHDDLDWAVWGVTPKKSGEVKSTAPIGAYDPNAPISSNQNSSSANNATTEDDGEDAPKAISKSGIRLLTAKWLEGKDGFEFNKECWLEIKAEIKDKSANKKVELSLVVEYKDKKEDLKFTASGELDSNGYVKIKVVLYYSDSYFDDLSNDPSAVCSYICKLTCKGAVNQIESDRLVMPDGVSSFFLDIRYFNPLSVEKDKLCFIPAGMKLKLMKHNTIMKNEVLGEVVSDGKSTLCIKTKLKEKTDLYFEIESSDKYINLETNTLINSVLNPSVVPYITMPQSFDLREKKAVDGRLGKLYDYTEKGEGTKDKPWKFVLEDAKVFLKLQYFKDSTRNFQPLPPGLGVNLYDHDYLSKNDFQGSGCLLKDGLVYLPVFIKDEDQPDLFFTINTDKMVLDKENGLYVKKVDESKIDQFAALPQIWSSRDYLDSTNNEGLKRSVAGDVGTIDSPWTFNVIGGIKSIKWGMKKIVPWDDADRATMKTKINIETTGFKDDTAIVVEVIQYNKSDKPTLIATVNNLKIVADNVVDSDGQIPEYKFLWHATIYDYKRPFYFLCVRVNDVVKTMEQTNAEMIHLIHHDGVISNPDGSLPNTEGPDVVNYLTARGPYKDGTDDSLVADGHVVESYFNTAVKVDNDKFEEHIQRNLFLHHQDSHGMAECKNHIFENWLKKSTTVGADGVTEWLCPKCKNIDKAEGFICLADDNNFKSSDVKKLKRTPKVLFMSSTCLSAVTDVFPKKWQDKGTRWYIGWAVPVSVSNAKNFSNAFYSRWMEFYEMDPDKVADAFNDVKGPYLNNRPRIFGA